MNKLSRRKLITTGIAATAGVSGLAAAARIADNYGLIPPDWGGIYGPGETLTYASHRLLAGQALAREFSRSEISQKPFAKGNHPDSEEFERLRAGGFVDWQLAIEGMVARPGPLSIAQLKSYPASSHITHLACEEGWSFIAEWIGVPLSRVLNAVGILPQARYIVYFSMQDRWWESIDMADALHPQTLLTYGMNSGELSVGHGGPLRMRVARQLGYKSVKFIHRMIVTEDLKDFPPKGRYSWYAGI
jgi:DMSO/TMAO reductase YedYZ molybdopterin-dependent catalytic subunit